MTSVIFRGDYPATALDLVRTAYSVLLLGVIFTPIVIKVASLAVLNAPLYALDAMRFVIKSIKSFLHNGISSTTDASNDRNANHLMIENGLNALLVNNNRNIGNSDDRKNRVSAANERQSNTSPQFFQANKNKDKNVTERELLYKKLAARKGGYDEDGSSTTADNNNATIDKTVISKNGNCFLGIKKSFSSAQSFDENDFDEEPFGI